MKGMVSPNHKAFCAKHHLCFIIQLLVTCKNMRRNYVYRGSHQPIFPITCRDSAPSRWTLKCFCASHQSRAGPSPSQLVVSPVASCHMARPLWLSVVNSKLSLWGKVLSDHKWRVDVYDIHLAYMNINILLGKAPCLCVYIDYVRTLCFAYRSSNLKYVYYINV